MIIPTRHTLTPAPPLTVRQISFASDATGSFSKALDLYFDATPFLGGIRSKRYAITTEDGKVKSVHVEQDPTKVEETGVDSVLG